MSPRELSPHLTPKMPQPDVSLRSADSASKTCTRYPYRLHVTSGAKTLAEACGSAFKVLAEQGQCCHRAHGRRWGDPRARQPPVAVPWRQGHEPGVLLLKPESLTGCVPEPLEGLHLPMPDLDPCRPRAPPSRGSGRTLRTDSLPPVHASRCLSPGRTPRDRVSGTSRPTALVSTAPAHGHVLCGHPARLALGSLSGLGLPHDSPEIGTRGPWRRRALPSASPAGFSSPQPPARTLCAPLSRRTLAFFLLLPGKGHAESTVFPAAPHDPQHTEHSPAHSRCSASGC